MRASLLGIALLSPCSFASEFFVSPSGSDENPGTSKDAAWQTLQHAADVVGPGAVVTVLPGHYQGFNLFTSGTAAAKIVFRADPSKPWPHPAVVIDQNNSFTNKDRINLEGASHVVIEGFTVIGSGNPGTNRACIRTVTADFVTVRRNRCDFGGKWGIFTGFVDDLLIEDNETSNAADEHGIYVSNSGDRPVIRRNVSHDNAANGIHMNGDLSEGGDGVISDALVERNVIYENGEDGGSGINCDGVRDSLFRNNLLFDNHASGISLYRIDGGAPSTNNVVVCNTIHNAADARWAVNIQDASTGNRVFNNILVNDHPSRGSIDISTNSLPGFTCDYNVVKDSFAIGGAFITFAQWKAQTGQDSHSSVATPAQTFAAVQANDYHLKSGSPALDTALALFSPNHDLLGKPRPHGIGFDRGCIEQGACVGGFGFQGVPLPGTFGDAPSIVGSGCPDHGSEFAVTAIPPLLGSQGILLLGTQGAATPFLGGTIYVVPIVLYPLSGSTRVDFLVPDDPALAGVSIRFQALFADPAAIFDVAISSALIVSIG